MLRKSFLLSRALRESFLIYRVNPNNLLFLGNLGEQISQMVLMWLSWLYSALGLQNDRQTDISSWYAIIRCDELYHVQIPLSEAGKKAWLFASFVMQQHHVIFPKLKNYIITFLSRSKHFHIVWKLLKMSHLKFWQFH